jgi:hypothetical protein
MKIVIDKNLVAHHSSLSSARKRQPEKTSARIAELALVKTNRLVAGKPAGHRLFRQSPSRIQAPGELESRSRSIDLLNKGRTTNRRTNRYCRYCLSKIFLRKPSGKEEREHFFAETLEA